MAEKPGQNDAQEEPSLMDDLLAAVREQRGDQTADDPSGTAEADTGEKAKSEASDAEKSEKADQLKAFVDSIEDEDVRKTIASMSDTAKAYLAARDKERADEIAQGQEQADRLKEAESALSEFDELFEPFKEALEKHGLSQAQATRVLLQTKVSLDADPSKALQALARSYGVSFTPGDTTDGDGDEKPDPKIAQLEQEIAQLKQGRQSDQAAKDKEIRAESARKVRAFAEAKGDDDKPLHPHYANEAVQDQIIKLLDSGIHDDLESAYNAAVMLVPEIREQVIKEETAARIAQEREQRDTDARQKAKEATRRTDEGVSDDTADEPLKEKGEPSLADDLQEALAAQRSRDAA